jgi:hypothetical protein
LRQIGKGALGAFIAAILKKRKMANPSLKL